MVDNIGQGLKIDTGKDVWQGNEVGVNSDIPLKDEGIGRPYIIRQFKFKFDQVKLNQIHEKKIPIPSKQDLFNSVWPQVRVKLWGDGLVAIEDPKTPPKIIIGKRGFIVILTCEPRVGVIVNDHINTLQEITKPKRR